MADSLILMVLALVVFGPRRLPQIGRQIGKLMYEFRKASNDFKFQMEEELRIAEDADRRKKEEEERKRVAALAPPAQASVTAPAQTIEAQADVGAVEPSTAASSYPGEGSYPEQYPAETSAAPAEPATGEPATGEPATGELRIQPRIQPPQTGEQVSASARPDSDFEPSAAAAPEAAATTELNPEASAEANAASVEANPAFIDANANVAEHCESGTAPAPDTTVQSALSHQTESSTPPKEPVSQHG